MADNSALLGQGQSTDALEGITNKLCKRHPNLTRNQVVDALDQSGGHGGKANGVLESLTGSYAPDVFGNQDRKIDQEEVDQAKANFPKEYTAPSPGLGFFSPRSEQKLLDNKTQASSSFGAPTISFAAGVMLLINNITGPGVPQLPNMFAESGWLFPTTCLLAVWFMTTVSSSMYAEAMSRIPGNNKFQGRIEYSTVVQYYFGRTWYLAAQIGLNGALQSLNVISVIQSAQVMDNAIAAIFGKTCALNITPFQNTFTDSDGAHYLDQSTHFFSCIDTNNTDMGNPWGCHVVLTCGFVLTAAMAIPAGMYNLDDNMIIQQVAFWITAGIWLVWFIATVSYDSPDPYNLGLPAVNTDPLTGSQAGVIGNILFNFGFVTTVPSWINEKEPSVKVNKSLWISTSLCIIIYLVIGLPGAFVFSDKLQGTVTNTCYLNAYGDASIGLAPGVYNCRNDLMQVLTQAGHPWASSGPASFFLKLSIYLFPIVAVVSSIPVFSIVIKYNLVENGVSDKIAFLWGVVFPWVISMPLLYMPNILAQFVNFTSLLFVSFTDFIVPFTLYIVLQRRSVAAGIEEENPSIGSQTGNPSALPSHELDDSELGAMTAPAAAPAQPLDEDSYHHAFSRTPAFIGHIRQSPRLKRWIAAVLGCVLTVAALIGTYLTITQGDYEMDAQTCALVGS